MFEDISIEKINKIFKLQLLPQIQTILSNAKNNDNLRSKIFINKVNFSNALNKIDVQIRIALASDLEFLEFKKKNPTLNDEQIFNNIGDESKENASLDFEFTFDYKESSIASQLEKYQAASLIKINAGEYNKTNYDYKNFNINDFSFIKPDQFKSLKLINFKKNDDKNYTFNFEAQYDNETKKILFAKTFGVGKYTNIYDQEFLLNNYNIHNFQIGSLTKEIMPKINNQIFTHYKNNVLAGGYGELRGIYTTSPKFPYQVHLGEDYLAPAHTAVLAPYDGEIVGIWHRKYKTGTTIGFSVGTTLLMRFKLNQIKLSSWEKERCFKGTNDDS